MARKSLVKCVEKALADYKLHWDAKGVDVEFWSPAGEDMTVYLRGDSAWKLAEDARESFEQFDAEEHASQIYHAKHYGDAETQRFYAGAPDSLEDLLEDARAIGRTYKDIADALEKVGRGRK